VLETMNFKEETDLTKQPEKNPTQVPCVIECDSPSAKSNR